MNLRTLWSRLSIPKAASVVFIDMPNVVNKDVAKRKGAPLMVRWELLRGRLDKETNGKVLLKAAYHRPAHKPEAVTRWKVRVEEQWSQARYTLKPYHKKDVDSNIVDDMWQTAKQAVDKGYKRLRFIIVSGDAKYAETYAKIVSSYHEQLTLELVVYSWRDALSRAMYEAASGKVRWLDRVPGLITSGIMSRSIRR